jgi:hypothetical protein
MAEKESFSWQRNSPIFMKSERYYHIHKNQLLDYILSKVNAVYNLTTNFLKISFNIILSWSL